MVILYGYINCQHIADRVKHIFFEKLCTIVVYFREDSIINKYCQIHKRSRLGPEKGVDI